MDCLRSLTYMLSNYISQEETPMKLKELRQNKNLSVPQLVEISGVPRRTIQDIEKNNNCKVDTAIKLADALGVTLDELCRD